MLDDRVQHLRMTFAASSLEAKFFTLYLWS